MPPLTPATAVDAITAAADRLADAAATRRPCAPVRDLIGSTDVAAAYGVQQRLTMARIEAGARIVGRKIGLTSEAVQAQLRVDQPDFGVLFDDMEYREDQPIPSAAFLQPRIEAEIAFVLGSDLDGDIDPATVVDAVSHAAVALEIVDSRIRGWDITFGDTVADNASSGGYVVGTATAPLRTFRPVEAVMELTRNGGIVSRGTGAACLGDPLNALTWLAVTARDLGQSLRAGQLVLSGALGPMVDVVPGDSFTATVPGLGSVTARFDAASAEEKQ